MTRAPRVLIFFPSHRDYLAFAQAAKTMGVEPIFDQLAQGELLQSLRYRQDFDILSVIQEKIELYKREPVDGIVQSISYSGLTAVGSCIGQSLGLLCPSPRSILVSEHKYLSRVAQRQSVDYATPSYWLIDDKFSSTERTALEYPLFLKPVISTFSKGAFKVEAPKHLHEFVKRSRSVRQSFVFQFEQLLKTYSEFDSQSGKSIIAESLLSGKQVSLEGYVFRGNVTIMGILDAFMFGDTISFSRFQYPSQLSESIQKRMHEIAEKYFTGIGFDNAPFNMELMYNPQTDEIHIIEVNPRYASQFSDLFEKVDGTSTASVVLSLALGEQPTFAKGKGEFRLAASCVFRSFADRLVHSVPSQSDVEALKARYPEAIVEIRAQPGKLLFAEVQDSVSFRYGLVHLGANSASELDEKWQVCQELLDFKLGPAIGQAQISH
ncbi:MAG: ATP-grasp domain-containing protein [Candidatus Obscuribacterales bacterium]|nr:ATP-grasp domain-containing protein [Candidatus Obscuribacterales bacterium]